jgi:hypothetical protein
MLRNFSNFKYYDKRLYLPLQFSYNQKTKHTFYPTTIDTKQHRKNGWGERKQSLKRPPMSQLKF